MDGQKTAHWQTQDFLCVNVCHLTPFVTISGVKESRLPVSQVVYSMMEWSSADQKIVSRCVCQLFILFFFFFGRFSLLKFFLVHAQTQFCIFFHAIEAKQGVNGCFSPQMNHWYVFVLQFTFLYSPFSVVDLYLIHRCTDIGRIQDQRLKHTDKFLSSFPAWKVSKLQY